MLRRALTPLVLLALAVLLTTGAVPTTFVSRTEDPSAATDRPLSRPPSLLAAALAPDVAASASNPLDARIADLQRALRRDGTASALLEALGWAFVHKARLSSDHGYHLLADRCARAMLDADPQSTAALLLRGHVLHSLHRFAEAKAVAADLVARRGSPLDHALHGDVLLDLGRLGEAARAYQRMMNRRPDSRAFARTAEVRILTGDLDGARQALRTAARAASARDAESFAWVWSRLAIVELQSGSNEEALAIAEAAVAAAPDSAVAALAHGRVLLALRGSEAATASLEKSAALSPLPDTLRALAEAYEASGRSADAARTLARLEAVGESADPRGFSIWLSESGRETTRALALAQAEIAKRRDVFTLAALALAESVAGRNDSARRHIAEALAHGTEDPRLWYHAALVAERSGETVEARAWFSKAGSQASLLLPSLRRHVLEKLSAADALVPAAEVAGPAGAA
ncbi:MAG: tetratricopeptide repeat protein [Candidatus Binatia bacterium]